MHKDDKHVASQEVIDKDLSPAPTQDGPLDRLKSWIGLGHSASIRDDFADALAEGGARDDFSPREKEMLKNVLALRSRRVDDVMVPRADIIAVSMDISLGELLRVFRTAGHSRLPVHVDTLDDPRGMVHIRDFLNYLTERAEVSPRSRRTKSVADLPDLGRVDLATPLSAVKILRPVLYAPPSMPAHELLAKMQTTRTHMALVIDEYGGTHGLVSIEDLVEIVVGEIEDEHDEVDAPRIVRNDNGTILVDARVSLEDLTTHLGLVFSEEDLAEDVETLGGLLATLVGRVPVRGEIIARNGIDFEILDADPRRIKRLRLHVRASGQQASSSAYLKQLASETAQDQNKSDLQKSDRKHDGLDVVSSRESGKSSGL
jgi:CBS domain containing-hemolysin-like protein